MYINSDNQKLNTYSEIKSRIGWYEVKITPNEITYTNDDRMDSEFPSESPGGYPINYKCDYWIKGETIELYEKNEDKSELPLKINGNKQKLVLTLLKKNNQFYGISPDISNSEKLVNSARSKNKSPYLFYRFDLN
ncbi:hypothetical protein [Frigoriflavimonas asaccharolytica]|uniref:Lipocalin-like protein n=1 Tax=Frigoriflavimonas asaccharolytica TaxID=2735899 RepID=A0A8J8KA69_9FLAO|nr:hypothetical protein [Frigoriflavimonas asaccharolytica]NRS93857.1 hypothetical protein [Frigoriflavimonas asaccharolytica]